MQKAAIFKYSLFILLGCILVTVILLVVYFNTGGSPTSQPKTTTQNENGTPSPTLTSQDGISSDSVHEDFPPDDYYGDYDPSGLENLQDIVDLPDGTKKYIATSSNPNRPNIIIAKDNRTQYQRSIPFPDADIPVQNFIELFGQPDRIINGPDFYGANATQEYIYAQKGIAVVVDTNGQVVEHHYFKPTTADDYVKKYSNDKF